MTGRSPVATFMRRLDLADRPKVNFEGAVTWAFEFDDPPCRGGEARSIELPFPGQDRAGFRLHSGCFPAPAHPPE